MTGAVTNQHASVPRQSPPDLSGFSLHTGVSRYQRERSCAATAKAQNSCQVDIFGPPSWNCCSNHLSNLKRSLFSGESLPGRGSISPCAPNLYVGCPWSPLRNSVPLLVSIIRARALKIRCFSSSVGFEIALNFPLLPSRLVDQTSTRQVLELYKPQIGPAAGGLPVAVTGVSLHLGDGPLCLVPELVSESLGRP